MKEKIRIIVSVTACQESGKWEIRVDNLPDFRIISHESDCLSIVAELAGSRFERPQIELH